MMMKRYGFTPFEIRHQRRLSCFWQGFRTGFTLIELMVVILIFSIIVAAIFGVLTMGRQSWQTGTTQVQLQQETRKAMDRMVKELRPANLISIGAGASSMTFKVPIDYDPEDINDPEYPYNDDNDVLDVNGDIEWGANDRINDRLDWTIEYSLSISNGQILRKVFDNASIEQINLRKVLANNISVLSFNSVSASEISVGITAQKDAIPGRTMQSNLQSQITLRN